MQSIPVRRVLQVLADPDPSPASAAAAALHRFLVARGFEVRTLALGPGRRPGLESDVPPMSPSYRSLAALLQFRREAVWADAVLLRGRRTAHVARFGGVPCVWCVDDPAGRPPKSGSAPVVVPDEASAAWLGRPALVLAPVVEQPELPDAARSAARELLNVAPGARMVLVLDGPDDRVAAAVRSASAGGAHVLRPGEAEDDVLFAAADEVVRTDESLVEHPVDLVRAVLAGASAQDVGRDGIDAVYGAAAGAGWIDLVERAVAARVR